MDKEKIEQILVEYGVSFTDALADRLMEEFKPCEDAISRSEVIKSIDEREDVNGKVDAESVRTDIVLMPPVNPQESKTDWIPVSERLPEEAGRYLAYIVNEHTVELQYIMTCDYSVDGYWHWFPDDECASDNVIAWMHLPEPYKAD